jgi:hypothetical protein
LCNDTCRRTGVFAHQYFGACAIFTAAAKLKHTECWMGFALWIDREGGLAWAQGTHEYRPMGAAAIASTDQFRHRDFRQTLRRPANLSGSFAGFFGSLEEVNLRLRSRQKWKLRATPAHLL